MEITPSEIEKILALLAENLRRIAAASEGMEDARLHWRPDEKSWSANDILAHLRACMDVWGKSVGRMLTEENGTQTHISPRSWIRKTNYLALGFRESLQEFAQQRTDFLHLLESLAFADWSRSAVIQGRQHTVFSQARRMALHESEHCEQIETILK